MASTNNLSSNFSRPIAEAFLKGFEASRVLTKTVNTQLLDGKFSPKSGTQVDFKRPHDYKSDRTSDGDISAVDSSDIIAGKATGTVQDYFTVHMDWDEVDQALKLDKLDEILKPSAARLVTDLETDFGAYMYKNCNLHYGAPGTAIDAWSDVAGANALMDSIGVPNDGRRSYVMNPFVTAALADVQNSLGNGSDSLVNTAWENSIVSNKLAGLRALSSNSLASRTSAVAADRAGTLTAAGDQTYVTAKDTMTQVISVTAFQANATIKAGDIITIAGRTRLSLATRDGFVDNTGSQRLWSGIVTADVVLGAAGEGDLVIAGPGIFEANGQYNTVNSTFVIGDVVTLLGTTGAVYQPAMFYHEDAYGIGTVPLSKLYATDTIATTEDGMQIRITKYSDGAANKQKIRFDLLPAYATFNPFFAGQGYGV
jgi:hypothetical protein